VARSPSSWPSSSARRSWSPVVLDGTDDAHAATTSTSAPTGPNAEWDPGLIFCDGVFRDWSSMTVDDIQTFLDHQGCEGDGCLRSGSYAWPGATVTWCDPVPAGTGSFAQMLSIITTGCRINPQVALVMIAKESQGLTRPDHHVGRRRQRIDHPRQRPWQMIALVLSQLAGLFVVLMITRFWKVSIHCATAGGLLGVFFVLFAPLALIAWSRVVLDAHTWTQVAVGTGLVLDWQHSVSAARLNARDEIGPTCWQPDPTLKQLSGPACRPISTIATRFNRRMGHRPGPGRKSKGDRDNFAVKPMRPVGDVIRANADRLGMTYGEYCAAILSTALGMPEYAPPTNAVEQQELPLKTA